jgi:hypothetical protein
MERVKLNGEVRSANGIGRDAETGEMVLVCQSCSEHSVLRVRVAGEGFAARQAAMDAARQHGWTFDLSSRPQCPYAPRCKPWQ